MRDLECQLKVVVQGSISDIDIQLSIQAGGEFLFQSQELAAPVILVSKQLVVVGSGKGNESNNTSVNFYAVPRCFDKAFPVLWGKSSAEGAISLNAGGFLINATIELISLLSKKDVDPEECKSFEEDKAEINKQIMRSPGFKK